MLFQAILREESVHEAVLSVGNVLFRFQRYYTTVPAKNQVRFAKKANRTVLLSVNLNVTTLV